MRRVSLSLLIVLACLPVEPVYGTACSSPAGNEADEIHNGNYHTWQFCNGTSWRAYAGAGFQLVSSGSGCTNPTGNEADQFYNYGYHTWQFCNGTNWIPFGAAAQTPLYPNGYFVLRGGTYTGNFAGYAASGSVGGRTGADAICLNDLTTNTGWLGYSTAKSEGLLVSGNVHALLCDEAECNTFLPNTTYNFADAGNSSAGGASFTTDAIGYGPQDSQNWSASTYFSATATYWTSMANSSGSVGNSENTRIEWVFSNNDCTNWTSASASLCTLTGNSNGTTWDRWASTTNTTCNNALNLICFVNPTP
jgi:hypothetical protein